MRVVAYQGPRENFHPNPQPIAPIFRHSPIVSQVVDQLTCPEKAPETEDSLVHPSAVDMCSSLPQVDYTLEPLPRDEPSPVQPACEELISDPKLPLEITNLLKNDVPRAARFCLEDEDITKVFFLLFCNSAP
jgi:hypothetical protein